MPKSSDGRFHMNKQLADRASKISKVPAKSPAIKSHQPPPGDASGPDNNEQGDHSELHPHGDGTYHSVSGGEQTEHPTLGHALMHMAAKHEPEGDHMHLHHDGMGGVKSSHVKAGGEVEEQDHDGAESAGQHVASAMGGEGGPEPDGDEGSDMDIPDMRGMMGM